VAQIFDHPEYLGALGGVSAVEIVHAPGMKSTALLLAGWLGAQLRWKLDGGGGQTEGLQFLDRHGSGVTVTLREEAGRALGSVRLTSGETTFLVTHREGSSFLYADIRLPGERESHYLMPGGKDELVALLDDELMSGGKHKVYLKAVATIVNAL
jgi:glucose-6-phosphate dehydrogenase assembly protein OpcA